MNTLLEVLLLASFRVTLVALVVGLALMTARVRSSSLRHTAWLGVLVAMLLMPVLPYVVPAVRVPVPMTFPATGGVTDDAGLDPAPTVVEPPSRAPGIPEIRPPADAPRFSLASIFTAIYLAGVLMLSMRLLAGWFAIGQVVRSSLPISDSTAGQKPGSSPEGLTRLCLFESQFISIPVTVGIWDTKVLLPGEWRAWPQEKLRAVLAHESAHVARRDTLTSLLAQVNCCLFWFHPLAWWLQRRLALTAECACDDAAVREVGAGGTYAEMLIEMAELMRRNGRRLSWQAPGVAGTGLLGQRIERILHGGAVGVVRRSWTILTAAGCALVILIVVACRERSAPPLREDPKLAMSRSSMKAYQEQDREIAAMSAAQVADLERLVAKQPHNIEVRKRLMRFYQTAGRKVVGEEKAVEGFRTHKIWLIRNHPEDDFASLRRPVSDPVGYEEERKLWLAVAARTDLPARAIWNAARFFAFSDAPLAEKLYLRAQTVEPQGQWARSLGELYASVLIGPLAHSPYGETVRGKLESSRDASLLEAVGFGLQQNSLVRSGNAGNGALASTYYERALQLKPDLPMAHMGLLALRHRDRSVQIGPIEKAPSLEVQYQAARQIPEATRFQLLPQLAEDAYWRGEWRENDSHDRAGANAFRELARKYARDLLGLAGKYRDDANYGTAIYKGNLTMGMVVMRVDGDKKAATRYLLAASKAPATDELRYSIDGFSQKLCVMLLRHGGASEREAVIEFLDRMGHVVERRDVNYAQAAQQLRQGYMPLWYEVQAAQLK